MPTRIALLILLTSLSLVSAQCPQEGFEALDSTPKAKDIEKQASSETDEQPLEHPEDGFVDPGPPPSLPKPIRHSANSKDPSLFRVRRDGFSFPNYTKRERPVDLTPETVERLCGRNSCARGSGKTCVLTGAMRTFMDVENRIMADGHCEGMSVLSQAIYMGFVPLSRFDKSARSTYDLNFNNQLLQSDIAYYCAISNTHPTAWSEIKSTPNEILNILRRAKEPYTLTLYDPGGKNGHAVVAIRVIDDRPGYSRIEVYDNEVPGKSSFVTVNTATNTWIDEDNRRGNAKTKSLGLLPLAKRFAKPTCLVDGETDDEFADDSDWEVSLSGPGKLSTTTPAKEIWRRVGKRESPSPAFLIKPKQEINFVLTGDGSQKQPTDFVAFRRGQAFSLTGIVLDDGEVDTVHLAKDGRSFRYSSSDKESVVFRFGATYKGDDYEIQLAPTSEKPIDMQVRNIIDSKHGEHALTLRIKSQKQPASYAVEIRRIGNLRDEHFSHQRHMVIGANETHRLHYGKWLKNANFLPAVKEIDGKAQHSTAFQISDDQ